ncbi:polysaccharide biosynthesis/export family protein [Azoarcus sp. KH32C]|uniref:polysaccharide biosynthesis/export family protein n=1 Tax=Azoarcus sp. KH32C TaxID=748247 RepID=UPI0018D32B6A|nr:polysaccharide biosynthesis/export family protein [Azoarcus sp. KH32C]
MPVQIVDISDGLARRLQESDKRLRFSEVLSTQGVESYLIGPGDVVQVSIWEAPPAALFGATMLDARANGAGTATTTLPEQMVASDGTITIPFAGVIAAGGSSPQQIEREITKRLTGQANQPQVLVRVVRNNTSNVTVVGDVASSTRMPLTARGERLLDALAAAGGVRQPVGKMTIQVTRGSLVNAMPLDQIIQDPHQNIILRPGDVVTALHQPLSLTVLGATGKNEDIPFEANGITLAQALARAGGLQDARADARGVFLFRFEDPSVLGAQGSNSLLTPDNKVPVVYRVDLTDPRSFFIAQGFPVRNKDVMYVANAPASELQKFLNILTSSLFSVNSLISLGR